MASIVCLVRGIKKDVVYGVIRTISDHKLWSPPVRHGTYIPDEMREKTYMSMAAESSATASRIHATHPRIKKERHDVRVGVWDGSVPPI